MLPDVLAPDLVTVFCGSAVGRRSAELGAYYAGPGNKFWDTLHRVGLTPRRYQPAEYRDILVCGIGLTDLNKTESGADSTLSRGADDVGALVAKIVAYQPALLAFTARRPAAAFCRHVFGHPPASYGLQPQGLGPTRIHVLPSPSGLARRYWDEGPWRALAAHHRGIAVRGRGS